MVGIIREVIGYMITESILTVLFAVANFLIGLLPQKVANIFDGTAGLGTILAYGLYFFPMDLWLFIIGQGVAMLGISLSYAILEWGWKKIPGVD